MNKRNRLGQCLLLCTVLAAGGAHATAVFENNTLTIPYVEYNDSLYRVDLILSENGDSIDFALGPASEYDSGTEAPNNAALFAGNVLSIPAVRVGTESYRVQLDYDAIDGLFRLMDAAEEIFTSTDGVECNYNDSTPNSQNSLTITSTSTWSSLTQST